jgi:outer membrane protein OmpA-like peptidoglycan-associated protein
MPIAPVVPGVTRFDATALVDAEARTVAAAIEGAAPLFVKGTARLAAGGEQVVRDQLDRLRSLDAVGRIGDRTFVVELIGEADSDGPPETNLPLSQHRAARVLEMLQAQPFTRVRFSATGIGSRAAADASVPDDVKQRNRRVSFRVTPAETGR